MSEMRQATALLLTLEEGKPLLESPNVASLQIPLQNPTSHESDACGSLQLHPFGCPPMIDTGISFLFGTALCLMPYALVMNCE